MVNVMHLYVDDSGTRNLDKAAGNKPAHGRDWFALGGVLIRQEDEYDARQAHAEFFRLWNLDPDTDYLHSTDIRNKTGRFTFISALSAAKKAEFYDSLTAMLTKPAYTGFACVIDRPGYEHRYRERFGREQWSLCKTAFAVLVERAAKYARSHGYKLKVFIERSDQHVDGWMNGYYDHLRSHGMPFDTDNMQKYGPLSAEELAETLYEFRKKGKSSAIMQVADMYLWPMAIGGYDTGNRAYRSLIDNGRLVNCHLSGEEIPHLGIKYSCWDLVE